MGTIAAVVGVRRELSALVIRCGCTDAQKALPHWHGRHNQACPNPRATEDRGVIATSTPAPAASLARRVQKFFAKE